MLRSKFGQTEGHVNTNSSVVIVTVSINGGQLITSLDVVVVVKTVLVD